MNAKVKFVLGGVFAVMLAVPVMAGPHHHGGGHHHHHGGYYHGNSGIRLATDIVNLVHSVIAPPLIVAPPVVAPRPVVVAPPPPVVVAPPPPPVVVAPRPVYYGPGYYHNPRYVAPPAYGPYYY